jgi:NAD(P)H-nitrite reductase large subunit
VKRQLHISGGQLVGLVAEGPWPNLGQFYQRVASGAEVDEGELAYFEIQGDFAQPSAESDTEPLCYCMQIHRSELLTAVSQGCNSVFELTEQTGAGSICGGCHTCLNQLMEESSGPFGPKA